MSLPSTIAVDGPAGSGKSTVSFAIAQRLNYLFVDTGAFYRAITWLALEKRIDPGDLARVTLLTQQAHLDITPDLANDGRQYTFLAEGKDITHTLHLPDVDAYVSKVAANSGVRAALVDAQRALAVRGRVIMAGRDIGTVILPDADLKIYIDASLEQRARRRYEQRLRNGERADYQEILAGLLSRDKTDSERENAPLLRAPDAVNLDTTHLTLEQAIETAYQIILDWKTSKE